MLARLVFTEGLHFQSNQSSLYYTSARKFHLTGDIKSALGLYRSLVGSREAPLVRAASLARLGELEAKLGRHKEAVELLKQALTEYFRQNGQLLSPREINTIFCISPHLVYTPMDVCTQWLGCMK